MGIRIVSLNESNIDLFIDLNLSQLDRSYPIDLTRKTGVLIRQSVKGADLTHYESRLRQEILRIVAAKLRGGDENGVIPYDEGAGVSGRKRIDERPELNRLYNDIASGIIGSVLVAREDRLFRDKHLQQVGAFTELAEKKKLIVIVPGKTFYDFTNSKHLSSFQDEMKKAYGFMDHVYYMIDTREQKRARGEYVGEWLIAPYVLPNIPKEILTLESPNRIIYEPWQEITAAIFRRLKDYNFNLSRLGHYIDSLPCIFPYPDKEDLEKYVFRVAMSKKNGGYTFTNLSNLKRWLIHPGLAGLAKAGVDEAGNEVYLENAWDTAISLDTLNETRGALTGIDLYGVQVQRIWYNVAKYTQKDPYGEETLLRGVIHSNNGRVQLHMSGNDRGSIPYYICVIRTGTATVDTVWTLRCSEVDAIVLNRLIDLSQIDKAIALRVKEYFTAKKSIIEENRRSIDGQISTCHQQIAHFTRLIDNGYNAGDDEIKDWMQKRRAAKETLALLDKKIQKKGLEQPTDRLPTFYEKLANLSHEAIAKMNFDEKKLLIDKLCRSIFINRLSPHLSSIRVDWITPVKDRPDIGLLWRCQSGHRQQWLDEEVTVLESNFSFEEKGALLKKFSNHTWHQIIRQAYKKDLRRSREAPISTEFAEWHNSACYADIQALIDMGVSWKNASEQINELVSDIQRGEIKVVWLYSTNLFGDFEQFSSEPGADQRQTG